MRQRAAVLTIIAALGATPAEAASELDGAAMSLGWALPFMGILLSIALGPLLFARVWHGHYGKIATGWAAATFVALALGFGFAASADTVLHAFFMEYVSFIVLLFALYTIAGGILVTGRLGGTPLANTGTLAFGAAIASVVGTTGASMVLIRPLIRANKSRPRNVHVVIFFILLVSNIGGALTPLGDPPLFVGYLRGVDFFWTTQHLLLPTCLAVATLLVIFFALDWWLCRGEKHAVDPTPERTRVRGLLNVVLIGGVIAAVLMPSFWQTQYTLSFRSVHLPLPAVARDLILLSLAALSVRLTPDEHREANGFTWEPIREVAILFAAIFICIAPVLAILGAGRGGALSWLLDTVTRSDGSPHTLAYFWLTGGLSALLDNAPTYLVFFELAGGKAQELMTAKATTLAAISAGAVFMGALTYIGNAPNFMVYAIAKERGIEMPSFFGYLAWSVPLLVPVLAVIGWLWFT